MVVFNNEKCRIEVAAAADEVAKSLPTHEAVKVECSHGPNLVRIAGEGPPLILLHPGLSSSAHILASAWSLTERFRVYAIDIPGHSPHAPLVRLDVRGPAHANWLREIMRGLNLERAHLFGISWGAFVATNMAAHHPQAVASMILMVPPGFANSAFLVALWRLHLPMLRYMLRPNKANLDRVAEGMMSDPSDDSVRTFLAITLRCYSMSGLKQPPRLDRAAFVDFVAPVLVLAARNDLQYPGEKVIKQARRIFAHVESELLESSHIPPMDEAFARTWLNRITEFVGKHAA